MPRKRLYCPWLDVVNLYKFYCSYNAISALTYKSMKMSLCFWQIDERDRKSHHNNKGHFTGIKQQTKSIKAIIRTDIEKRFWKRL